MSHRLDSLDQVNDLKERKSMKRINALGLALIAALSLAALAATSASALVSPGPLFLLASGLLHSREQAQLEVSSLGTFALTPTVQ